MIACNTYLFLIGMARDTVDRREEELLDQVYLSLFHAILSNHDSPSENQSSSRFTTCSRCALSGRDVDERFDGGMVCGAYKC